MNKVIYGLYEFSDADRTLIQGGMATAYYSPLGDELRAGECSIPVVLDPAAAGVTPAAFKAFNYGDPVDIYENSTLLYRFYLTDITGGQRQQGGTYAFTLKGVDFAGILINQETMGGVYSNATAGDLIMEITGASLVAQEADSIRYMTGDGIQFTVDNDRAALRMDGWVPAGSARDALKDVLQLSGAILTQDAAGDPRIGPVDSDEVELSNYDIYMGDSYEDSQAVTGVAVIEYDYLQLSSAGETEIYSGVDALQDAVIMFDKPYYNLRAVGLTINSSGANYANVTGVGSLYGIPYTIATRQIKSQTDRTGGTNTRTVDNPLMSSLYSAEVLERLSAYYSDASIVSNAAAQPEPYTAGQLLRYTDPIGEQKTGYVTEASLLFSGITKATQKVTADWDPDATIPFTISELITSSGTWTPPANVRRIRFVLIGGGSGGWGGYAGQNGGDHNTNFGAGGDPGEGGDGGKVFQVDFSRSNIAPSYTVSLGSGGAGGSIDHGEGGLGTATTLTAGGTEYSSDRGVVYPYGVTDILTGDRYAETGEEGIYKGGDGTGYAHPAQSVTDTETTQTGTTTTWTGGIDYPNTAQGGGGAAYGEDGGDAVQGHRGGNGANAALDGFNGYVVTNPAEYGQGGLGGNGGGGGGCGGTGDVPAFGDGKGGVGGHGSVGGPGGNGAVLVLMAVTGPAPTEEALYDSNGEQLFGSDGEALMVLEA